jgi:hypothetical protein
MQVLTLAFMILSAAGFVIMGESFSLEPKNQHIKK